MGSITYREFRTWVAWKKDQWNNPDRTDYYLMQIAGYVKHVMSKKSWNIKDLKIPIKHGEPTQQEVEQKTARAKANWRARANPEKKSRRYGHRS